MAKTFEEWIKNKTFYMFGGGNQAAEQAWHARDEEIATLTAECDAARVQANKAALIERKNIGTVLDILIRGVPGAAFNAVTEDYPEIASQIADLREKLERVRAVINHANTKTSCALHYSLLINDIQSALEGKE